MSVATQRLAAAQRTAAVKRSSRWKRFVAWVIVLPALGILSFAVIAKASALRAKPDLGAAVSQLAHHAGGAVMVLDTQVCWISRGQFTRVSTVFSTSTRSLAVGGTTYTLVAAQGVDRATLEQLLGVAVACRTASTPRFSFMP
jgi:uncharacterized membrane protein